MDVESRMLLLLILLLNITVSVSAIQHVKVSCRNEICALKESSVNLKCSYSNINITTGFWFSLKDKAKWRKEEQPEDLALDSDYAGRVSYTEMTNFSSTLTITDLRERDSGEYRLMFFTDKGEKYLSSAGVTLTVTDLQVTRDSTEQALTCRTSCLLTSAPHQYYWYRNGQYLKKYTDNMETFPLRNAEDGSYSCSFHGYNNIHSPPLCVNRNCLSVTYPEKRVCVLEGSSVEFAGSYSHPSDQRVSKAFWHSHKDFQDLKQETQFTNRVEYVNKNRSCTLKMNQLTKKDSGEYCLRLAYNDKGLFSGRPGVVLSVTDLQVRVSHSAVASEGQTRVTLSCIASCTLSNNPTYMWYKNGQPVTNKLTKRNKLYLNSSEDAGDYSCAVRGREDLRSPEQTGTLFSGDKQSLDEASKLAVWGAAALVAALLLSFLTAVLCIKRKRGAETDTDIQSVPKPGEDTYTALNPMTMSPDYDTLQNVQGSASDTYTTLNPATMSSDYDTLRNVQGSASDTYTTLNPATMSSDYDTLRNVQGSASDTYTTLNPATMSSDYDTLRNVQGSASDTYTTLNPATMSSDYDTLRNVQGSASDTYTTLNPATMSSDYDTLRK
ncbi:uncharacterized protein LOC128317451 [Pangasianodon hypophthalmus]|uniref:uncharacterized protein LOC128317451 n=1 Tax=Pangasianodon hypophthalmus TaxID=310915 RepID=UPI002307F7BF|nr:uncharacterized protein LOC128317451 [Pangasianodon hypophthalmus]